MKEGKAMDKSILEEVRERFGELVAKNNLSDRAISVVVKTLTPEEAIGNPGRRDFPIVLGKERVIEAEFEGTKAQAFTDSPKEFAGKLGDALTLPFDSNGNRAVFIAVLNAVLRYLGMLEKTLHCRDEEPEHCARETAAFLKCKYPQARVGLVGLNPAIAESLADVFGAARVWITDLNPDNVGRVKYGVEVWDGRTRTEDLVKASDVVLLTGTTLANGTFDALWRGIERQGKGYLIYGVTSAGVCELMGLDRICLYGRT
ncbi:MAG: hypothetical protein A4E57_00839 [Syntrophorhabdaceae bacterium PtaU1.Bin034]|jgi:hypothetical protein|nr:MAG: hypothetical protein A4E57_00839 [Syntrophorhabdaceae bacterium PtaU1.Bin034]